jgi:hypothetical protein
VGEKLRGGEVYVEYRRVWFHFALLVRIAEVDALLGKFTVLHSPPLEQGE